MSVSKLLDTAVRLVPRSVKDRLERSNAMADVGVFARDTIVRTLYPYGAERRVLRGPLRGMRYAVVRGMGLTYALGHSAYGAHEWSERLSAGNVVYDIGANCGQSALVFARLVGSGGFVYSFEPWAEQFQHLARNVELNGLGGHVRALQLAVASSTGQAEFSFRQDRPTQGKLSAVEPTYRYDGATAILVQTTSLDDFVADPQNRPPDVIKIDVEGGAAEVLRGAQKTLRSHRPRVYIELHGPEEQVAVRDWLQSAGYKLTRDGREITDPVARWENPLWCLPRA